MFSSRINTQLGVAILIVAPSLLTAARCHAQAPAPPSATKPASAPAAKSQSELANPKVVFGSIAETDPKVKSALEAHKLAAANAFVGKAGSLIGTISGIYAPKGNKIVILNFDRDYKTAISAIIGSEDFAKFPDLKVLTGKKVVLSGKYKAFKETVELVVTSPGDVKIVK